MNVEAIAIPVNENSLPPWVVLCSNFAPYASALVFVAPVPTIRKIMLDRSVGGLPLLPYSSMVANCFIWVVYGLLINENIVWQTNTLGLVLGLLYCNEFRKHCPAGSSVRDHMVAVSIVSLNTCLFAALLPVHRAASLVGIEGVILCILMFASPLAKLKDVIKAKSAKTIPLPFTLASLLNCLLWSIVGWFKLNDFMIYTPNLLGLSFALCQGALKLYFRSKVNHDKDVDELELIITTPS